MVVEAIRTMPYLSWRGQFLWYQKRDTQAMVRSRLALGRPVRSHGISILRSPDLWK